MRVIENETVVMIDVDNTLAMWHSPKIEASGKIAVPYGDSVVYLTPHWPNIDLIKEYKNRGYFLQVHSANGYRHATNVVLALGLQNVVDQIQTKNIKVVDDKPPSDWMGALVYLPEDFYGDITVPK
jgi:hypothetical protein